MTARDDARANGSSANPNADRSAHGSSDASSDARNRRRGSAPPDPDPAPEISPAQVKTAMDRGERFVLVDCRTPDEFETARIEGATLLPLQEAPARVEELASARSTPVVVYCHHGVRSQRMASFLMRAGFTQVQSMAGGIDRWSLEVDPSVPRY